MENRLRKRVMIVMALVMTSALSAVAQQGEKAIGGNLLLGTGGEYSHVGIGAKFLYNVSDPIRMAGEFDLFPAQDYLSCWDLSAYGQYLFPVNEYWTVYPSAGLGMFGVKAEIGTKIGSFSAADTFIALSLGGGFDYQLSDNLVLNGELRLKIFDDGYRHYLTAGLVYKF